MFAEALQRSKRTSTIGARSFMLTENSFRAFPEFLHLFSNYSENIFKTLVSW